MPSVHTVFKLTQLRWTGHNIRAPDERLRQKTYMRESALTVARGNATKTPCSYDTPLQSWEQAARSDQSGVVSSTTEQLIMKKRVPVKL